MSDQNSLTVQDATFWKLKLQENLSNRRGTMYRFLASSLQLLLFGNAGGIGFILGIFRTGNEPPVVHWLCVSAIIVFMLGCLTSAVTLIFTNALSMKEAHAAETALNKLINNKMSGDEAAMYMDNTTFPLAARAMVSGICSLIFLAIGAALGVVLLLLYY
ncbi:MAG: hypothetical protein HYX48_06785 [Chlamydiales bacterium]|nr:hypothetical protein [Chlamydiales bacterium]